MLEVQDKSRAIGAFIEWLRGPRQLILASFLGNPEQAGRYELFPEQITIENLLAEYFEIDLNKVEEEKVALLELQRELNKSHSLMEVLG